MIRTAAVLAAIAGLQFAYPAHALRPANPAAASSVVENDGLLPIRRITLYRSGVASFERRATVDGDTNLQLRFKTDQINDILKSLVVLDLSGGQVSAVRYASREPLDRRLSSFDIDPTNAESISDLARQLRGTSVTITTPDATIKGTVLGVESRVESLPAKGDGRITVDYVTLSTPSGIRAASVPTITSFAIDDERLRDELARALAAIDEHRADNTKTVDISLKGAGSRDIVASYIHESPVWKTSYRLILPRDQAESKKVTLQGWAIVENTTDEDWRDVSLSLVSGRPVSFTMDLYEPLYLSRPDVPVPTVPGVMPRMYSAGQPGESQSPFQQNNVDESVKFDQRAERGDSAGKRIQRDSPAPAASPMADAGFAGRTSLGVAMEQLQSAAATGVDAGELFQYVVSTPVTVERQQSAMIPIISGAMNGRRVSIYNRADGSQSAMRGVEITNSTDLQLLPGPITVFDDGVYAGDAQIGHVAAGDKRLLAYSVDLELEVTPVDGNDGEVRSVRIVDGFLELQVKQVTSTTYTIVNRDHEEDRTLLIEHAKMGGWTLVEPAKASDETPNLYRFEKTIAPGKTETLKVAQEIVSGQRHELLNYDAGSLLQLSQQGKASAKVIEAFREAARRRAAINEQERIIAQFDQQRAEISADQDRVRKNLSSVDKSSELYARYIKRLSEQETQLEQIETGARAAREAKTKAEAALNEFLRGLNVE